MTLKERIKTALNSTANSDLKENISIVRKLNDKIEDILNFSDDHAKLSTEQLRRVERTLQASFEAVALWQKNNPTKELDPCDEVNEVTLELESIVQEMFTETQTTKLQKLQSWVNDLQAAIEDLEVPEIDEADALIHEMDMYALGVKQDYIVTPEEMARLFAPGSYPIRKDPPTPYKPPAKVSKRR